MDREDPDERRQQQQSVSEVRQPRSLFGFTATMTALFMGAVIVGNIISLRRRLANIHLHSGGNSTKPAGNTRRNSSSQQHGRSQQQAQRSPFHQINEQEARRLWAEHFREMERIRRGQEAFNQERMRYKRNYDSWQERHGDKWDWKWHGNRWEWQGESERVWHGESADDWRRESQRSRTRAEPSREIGNRQHYVLLGLDPSKSQMYTAADIKAAFRAKALEFHPDTNQTNKADAEKKFHKVMEAYKALQESKPK